MSGPLAFNLFLLAIAAYFVWSATGYEPQARQIPLLIGGMVLILQAWVTLREFTASARRLPLTAGVSAEGAEQALPADEIARVAAMCGWMAVFFALFVLLGTLAATLLFIFLFLAAGKKLSWWGALAVAAAVSSAIWLLFVRVMHFELYPGLLFGGTLPPI